MTTGFDNVNLFIDGLNKAAMTLLQEAFENASAGAYSLYTKDLGGEGGAHRVEYGFLNNFPRMHKWVGSRIAKQPRGFTQYVDSETYEATLELPRKLVDMDPTGAVAQGIQQFSSGGMLEFPDDVCRTAFHSASGAGPTCFDGGALFSASHSYAPAGVTNANLGAGTTLTDANVKAAEAAGNLWQEENGRLFGTSFDTIIVGPKHRFAALELFADQRAIGANTATSNTTIPNVLSGYMRVVIDAQVTTKYWTLMDSRKPKPIAFFLPRAPEVVNQDKKEDDHRFNTDNYLFGIEADAAAIGLFWPSVYRGTEAG